MVHWCCSLLSLFVGVWWCGYIWPGKMLLKENRERLQINEGNPGRGAMRVTPETKKKREALLVTLEISISFLKWWWRNKERKSA